MKKTNTKNTSAVLTIDLTNATCALDVYAAFADAKLNNVNLSKSEMEAYCSKMVDNMLDDVNITFTCSARVEAEPIKPKKQNIFKRAWNWITGKK